MSNWKQLFTNTILSRGEEIFKKRGVIRLGRKEEANASTYYSATVIDSNETYSTSILLDSSDEVDAVYCTCQYFKKLTYCKHIAALLYSVEEEEEAWTEEDKTKTKAEKYSPIPFKDDGRPHFLSFGDTLNLYMPSMKTLKRAQKVFEDGGVRNTETSIDGGQERYLSYRVYVNDDKDQSRNVTIKLGRKGITEISCNDVYSW